MRTVAVAGSRGFIGAAVTQALTEGGVSVVPLPSMRSRPSDDGVVELLRGCHAVVNAAGMATAGAAPSAAMTWANELLPEVLAHAARDAGCTRFVHISSAAVQGRMDPLDESIRFEPFSPYSRSKARAEQRLLQLSVELEVVIYRATSVQGVGRGVTSLLARYASLPLVPLNGDGSQPVPVSVIENAAAAVRHLVLTTRPLGPIVLHPWEEMTTSSLLRHFGWTGRRLPIPGWVAEPVLRGAAAIFSRSARVSSRLRSAELLLLGQSQRCSALAMDGFVPPVGEDGYARLASLVRRG